MTSGRSTKETRREQTRQRVERQRAAQLRAERQRRVTWAIGTTVGILALIGVIVLVAVDRPGPADTVTSFGPASLSVVTEVTSVPTTALDAVGVGSATTDQTQKLTGAALTSDGKPRVLFVGAEFCPYCAFERWGMAVALSRFGTLGGLQYMKSSATDTEPNTNTFTFTGSTYVSDYITFDPHEIEDRNGKVVETLSSADDALFQNLGGGSFPFIDVAGKYSQATSGSTTALDAVHGKTWDQIAAALKDPTSPVAKAVLGTANQITAEICAATDNKPADVCTSSGVQAATKALSSVS